jgi:glycosyltransferase involved in cell wall biosynthesis
MGGKVLLITPYFPPVSVSGAKRPLHLVRHLPAQGWTPIVLASPPESGAGDTLLAEAVPEGTVVSRRYWSGLRGGERPTPPPRATPPRTPKLTVGPRWKYLTPFDRFLTDTPHGIAEALRLIDAHSPDLIHVIADPWSVLPAGDALHALTGLPLVVDLRDPWSQHAGKMALRPGVSRAFLRWYERRVFRRAARVVLNTEAARDAYADAYDGAVPGDRFTFVRNACDESLFDDPGASSPDDVFTLLYFGTFRLFVEPDALLRAFARFVERRGIPAGGARLRLAGGLRAEDHARIATLGLTHHVDAVGAVPFRQSLALLRRADVLCLVIQPDCTLQIPGKFYDYLGARRQILALSANTEVNTLLERTGAGIGVPWGDEGAAAEAIGRLYDEKCARAGVAPPPEIDLEPFGAAAQARKMAGIYEAAVRARR